MVGDHQYIAPVLLSKIFAEIVIDKSSQILDLGCGTGLVGEALRDLQFHNVDGLDFSKEMLDAAQQKKSYRNLIHADLTKTTNVRSGAYDAQICAGLFTYGHLDATCIDECFRMLKVGGVFSTAIREQIWTSMGFSQKFDEMVKAGQVEIISKENLENYTGGEKHGVYLFCRKLSWEKD